MARVTLEELKGSLKNLNEMLSPNLEVHLGQRYGYKALDLYDSKGNLRSTLRSGMSSSEVYEYIWAMVKGMELYEEVKSSKKLKRVL